MAMYGIGDATGLLESVTYTCEHPPAATEHSLSSTSQHWPINYLSFVRHFDPHDHAGRSVLTDLDIHIEMDPRLKFYVEKHKLA